MTSAAETSDECKYCWEGNYSQSVTEILRGLQSWCFPGLCAAEALSAQRRLRNMEGRIRGGGNA